MNNLVSYADYDLLTNSMGKRTKSGWILTDVVGQEGTDDSCVKVDVWAECSAIGPEFEFTIDKLIEELKELKPPTKRKK